MGHPQPTRIGVTLVTCALLALPAPLALAQTGTERPEGRTGARTEGAARFEPGHAHPGTAPSSVSTPVSGRPGPPAAYRADPATAPEAGVPPWYDVPPTGPVAGPAAHPVSPDLVPPAADGLTPEGLNAPAAHGATPTPPGTRPTGPPAASDEPGGTGDSGEAAERPETALPGQEQHAPGGEGHEAPSTPPHTAGERPGHSGEPARPDRPGARQREDERRRESPRRSDGSTHGEGRTPPSGSRPAARPSDQAIGRHDLYESDSPAPGENAEGRGDRVSARPSGQVLPVLPLGAGMALIGLGLAFLALRLRRG